MDTIFPFIEKISGGSNIRIFSEKTKKKDLKWHRDGEDRTIICHHNTNWEFQKDNELPLKIIKDVPITIKKDEWHRLIKGTNRLTLEIIKHN